MRDNIEIKSVRVPGRYTFYHSLYGTVEDVDLSVTAIVGSREYSGVTTPNFGSVTPLPFNPYNLTRYVSGTGLFVYSWNNIHPYPLTRSMQEKRWAYPVLSSVNRRHRIDADYIAQERLYESFSAIKLNLAQFFAERQQVVNMIGSTARRVTHAMLALRKARFGDAYRALGISFDAKKQRAAEYKLYDYLYENKKISRKGGRVTRRGTLTPEEHRAIAKEVKRKIESLPRDFVVPDKLVASYWLELQYGWQPLLSDVYAASEVLSSKFRTEDFAQAVTASAKYFERSPMQAYPSITTMGYGKDVGQFTIQTKTKLVVLYKPTNSFKSVMAQAGLSNPALLAWELLPYSFVVDWFLPVGNYLENMKAMDGYEIKSINRTRFTKWSIDVSGDASSYSSLGGEINAEKWTITYFESGISYTRDILHGLTQAPLAFKNPVSIVHAANAIALLTTAFRR